MSSNIKSVSTSTMSINNVTLPFGGQEIGFVLTEPTRWSLTAEAEAVRAREALLESGWVQDPNVLHDKVQEGLHSLKSEWGFLTERLEEDHELLEETLNLLQEVAWGYSPEVSRNSMRLLGATWRSKFGREQRHCVHRNNRESKLLGLLWDVSRAVGAIETFQKVKVKVSVYEVQGDKVGTILSPEEFGDSEDYKRYGEDPKWGPKLAQEKWVSPLLSMDDMLKEHLMDFWAQ